MNKILRGQGVTSSERYLAALYDRTFLDYWSYPNVYRDQGRRAGKGAGKELCDILVVFDRHVIIFSEKSVAIQSSGDVNRDWRRWCDRAVVKSARQALGAERWISQHQNRLFVDPHCTQPLPVPLPNALDRKVHCVVVARGASARCKEFYGGGNGSLFISCAGLPRSPTLLRAEQVSPFCTGDINPGGTFVHVFDDFNFELLLKELDTISDFVAYIIAKEEFIRSGHLITAAGEEELLAYYLRHLDSEGKHGFPPPSEERRWREDEFLSIDEGLWSGMLEHPQYLAKKRDDKISYLWDGLISLFTRHMLGGTSTRVPAISERALHEGGVRYMAMEPRVARRLYAKMLADAIEKAPPDRPTMRAFMSESDASSPTIGYVFLQVPFLKRGEIKNYDAYRELRRGRLYAYCMAMRSQYPHLQYVVGVAMEPPKYSKNESTSEDIVLIDASEWTADMQSEAGQLRERLKLFDKNRMVTGRGSEKEWPDIPKEIAQPEIRGDTKHLNRAERRRQGALRRRNAKRQD